MSERKHMSKRKLFGIVSIEGLNRNVINFLLRSRHPDELMEKLGPLVNILRNLNREIVENSGGKFYDKSDSDLIFLLAILAYKMEDKVLIDLIFAHWKDAAENGHPFLEKLIDRFIRSMNLSEFSSEEDAKEDFERMHSLQGRLKSMPLIESNYAIILELLRRICEMNPQEGKVFDFLRSYPKELFGQISYQDVSGVVLHYLQNISVDLERCYGELWKVQEEKNNEWWDNIRASIYRNIGVILDAQEANGNGGVSALPPVLPSPSAPPRPSDVSNGGFNGASQRGDNVVGFGGGIGANGGASAFPSAQQRPSNQIRDEASAPPRPEIDIGNKFPAGMNLSDYSSKDLAEIWRVLHD